MHQEKKIEDLILTIKGLQKIEFKKYKYKNIIIIFRFNYNFLDNIVNILITAKLNDLNDLNNLNEQYLLDITAISAEEDFIKQLKKTLDELNNKIILKNNQLTLL